MKSFIKKAGQVVKGTSFAISVIIAPLLVLLGLYRDIGIRLIVGIILVSILYLLITFFGRKSLNILKENRVYFNQNLALKNVIYLTHWIKVMLVIYLFQIGLDIYTGYGFEFDDLRTLNVLTMTFPLLLLIFDLSDLLLAKILKYLLKQ